LERKAAILFDQRNLHGAMLAYLASLRIYESYIKIGPDPQTQCNHDMFQVERARLLYAIGRTLHDREEYVDALSMYSKALEVQRDIVRNIANQHQNARVDVITTLCNVGRIHHLLGDLDKALRVNNEVVNLAIEMVTRTDDDSSSSPEPSSLPESHDFVRNRMISLGNLYVEAGRLEEAMTLFTRIARSQGLESMFSYRPEGSDIDTSAFAVKAAERLGKIGLQIPHAAAA
jgi:tetratricopeptide (TPR) repeat protein